MKCFKGVKLNISWLNVLWTILQYTLPSVQEYLDHGQSEGGSPFTISRYFVAPLKN